MRKQCGLDWKYLLYNKTQSSRDLTRDTVETRETNVYFVMTDEEKKFKLKVEAKGDVQEYDIDPVILADFISHLSYVIRQRVQLHDNNSQ